MYTIEHLGVTIYNGSGELTQGAVLSGATIGQLINVEIVGYTSIGANAFYQARALESVIISASVQSIGAYAFYETLSLTSVEFEDKSLLNTISDAAFSKTGLKSIIIPASVTSIGASAFSNASDLTSIEFKESSLLNTIGMDAFTMTSLLSIKIPATVTRIEANAFFIMNELTKIQVDPENTSYSSDDYGVLFNYDKTTLIKYPANNGIISYTIPASVTSIGDDAFINVVELTDVKATPDSLLKTIGQLAFKNAQKLASITIPAGVTSLGYAAFDSAKKLSSVIFENDSSLETIGDNAFTGAESLKSILLPPSVISIGVNAFEHTPNVINRKEGNEVKIIFRTNVNINSTVDKINDALFNDKYSISKIMIGDTLYVMIGDKIKPTELFTNIELFGLIQPTYVIYIITTTDVVAIKRLLNNPVTLEKYEQLYHQMRYLQYSNN